MRSHIQAKTAPCLTHLVHIIDQDRPPSLLLQQCEQAWLASSPKQLRPARIHMFRFKLHQGQVAARPLKVHQGRQAVFLKAGLAKQQLSTPVS